MLNFEQLKRASEVPVESDDHMDNNTLIRGSSRSRKTLSETIKKLNLLS